MKASSIVNELLEANVDDPGTFLRHFQPSALEVVYTAQKEVLKLPYDDNGDLTPFYLAMRRIINDMVDSLEQITGREAQQGTRELLMATTQKPWNRGTANREYAREILASFRKCSTKRRAR